jgi:hypothetical protein
MVFTVCYFLVYEIIKVLACSFEITVRTNFEIPSETLVKDLSIFIFNLTLTRILYYLCSLATISND